MYTAEVANLPLESDGATLTLFRTERPRVARIKKGWNSLEATETSRLIGPDRVSVIDRLAFWYLQNDPVFVITFLTAR